MSHTLLRFPDLRVFSHNKQQREKKRSLDFASTMRSFVELLSKPPERPSMPMQRANAEASKDLRAALGSLSSPQRNLIQQSERLINIQSEDFVSHPKDQKENGHLFRVCTVGCFILVINKTDF